MHCHTNVENVTLLPEGVAMTSHKKIVEPWEEGPPSTVHEGTNVRSNGGGGAQDNFFCGVYVDDSILVTVQNEPTARAALTASASGFNKNPRAPRSERDAHPGT